MRKSDKLDPHRKPFWKMCHCNSQPCADIEYGIYVPVDPSVTKFIIFEFQHSANHVYPAEY